MAVSCSPTLVLLVYDVIQIDCYPIYDRMYFEARNGVSLPSKGALVSNSKGLCP